MTKEQFINWFNTGEKFRQNLLELEKVLQGYDIFETSIGNFYDQYIDLPNFSEEAKELIWSFIWEDNLTCWHYNEIEYLVIDTIEMLYYVVMELSHMEIMKMRIDFLLPEVDFSCATIWFPGEIDESMRFFRVSDEEADKIVLELNNYIKINYPNRDVVVHYDNEKFNLWNNEWDDC